MKLIVADITDETSEIRSFRLVQPDHKALPQYEPGAHIDITGPTGITRQYSLCGDIDDHHAYVIAVKREAQSRGGSAALHDAISVGMPLEVSEPRNLFALSPIAAEHQMFAAGIGITPLLSMAYKLMKRGEKFLLHYFVRSREHAAFIELLESPRFASQVRVHVGVAREQMAEYVENCMTGMPSDAHVYTCGPQAFMETVVACAGRHVREDAIHLEHFQAKTVEAPAGGEKAFSVKLAFSGKILLVPAGETIVDVLTREGIAIDTSCREGICGTCVVPLLEGEADHRDNCLSKKEKLANDQICTCVSRAKSDCLTLEL